MTKKQTPPNDRDLVDPMSGSRKSRHGTKFAFFGTSHLAVYVLEALNASGLVPALIVAPPDKPRGRGLAPAPVAVAVWAREHNVPLASEWSGVDGTYDVGIVVDYGKILPRSLLDTPRRGFLNVHPSLLPKLRGPSPIRSAILNDDKSTGISVMLVDEKMDHGPIVAQKRVALSEWPVRASALETILMREGGTLLAQILPQWVAGEIDAREQNHDVATYSEKIKKEDGLLDLSADPYKNLLKIHAYEGWPGTYTFFERAGKKIRVSIIGARLEGTPSTSLGAGKLILDTVKPEGKREMPYEEFLRSGATPTSR